ncbi:hypothetical protein G7046_g10147 [Stylonectria norvegica]|nr:hypothetical protein G7046_g10147 [Stylonectria norvegica]
MEPRDAPAEEDGSSQAATAPPIRRRVSMEEDFFYQHIMTSPPRPSQPPPYQQGPPTPSRPPRRGDVFGKEKEVATTGGGEANFNAIDENDEELPGYTSSIALQGVFSKKHEIEETIKRAEDRQWHNVYVTLEGTALNVYRVKKVWGWGRTRDDGPSIDTDNPPWMKKGTLEKSYSLLYADVGIAADYKKRRYVIRVRAETDQFLLSCVELSTFVKWLEGLFAAIDVAAPIDDRDFPRDMSIPRIQRIRWFRGESPTNTAVDLSEVDGSQLPEEAITEGTERRESVSSILARDDGASSAEAPIVLEPSMMRPAVMSTGSMAAAALAMIATGSQTTTEPEVEPEEEEDVTVHPPRIDPVHRLSTTSYSNIAIDPSSGKWFPEHRWSSAHDMLYAKLCYSNLLFRSPRKSSYIISKGKQWCVDWQTGRMVRVLPPAYGEIEWFGPWQVIHTENRRI